MTHAEQPAEKTESNICRLSRDELNYLEFDLAPPLLELPLKTMAEVISYFQEGLREEFPDPERWKVFAKMKRWSIRGILKKVGYKPLRAKPQRATLPGTFSTPENTDEEEIREDLTDVANELREQVAAIAEALAVVYELHDFPVEFLRVLAASNNLDPDYVAQLQQAWTKLQGLRPSVARQRARELQKQREASQAAQNSKTYAPPVKKQQA